MKALSVKQPWASLIASGQKPIETRVWPTNYRGELLIVSSKSPKIDNLPCGMALCVVNLIDCRPMVESDQEAAQCEVYEGAWSWVFENIRPIEPFPVRGQLGIYDVECQPVILPMLV